MNTIEILVQGQHYHEWPCLKVLVNNQTVYDNYVSGLTTIKFDLDQLQPNNTLTLVHHSKQFGENGIYDTDHDGGQDRGLDRGIYVKDIRFDGITIGEHKINQLVFQTQWTQLQQQELDSDFVEKHSCFECNGYMGFNGHIDIDFWAPIMEWLTVYKYKVDRQSGLAYFSAYDQRWHYNEDLKIIKEIKELMKFE